MRTLDNINKFLVEKLGQKAQPTLLDAFNALSRAYGGEGKARSKEKALEELEKVFIGPEEGLALIWNPSIDFYIIGDVHIGVLVQAAKLHGLDTSAATSGVEMFCNWGMAEEIDTSNLDTENIKDASFMFSGCRKLKTIGPKAGSNFCTKNMLTMRGMFEYCYALEELDVSGWDTRNVSQMSAMFTGCRSLKKLDVSNFNTSEVTSMGEQSGGMFSGCSGLTELNVSNFDTSKVTDMREMFSYCSGLTELDLSNWVIGKSLLMTNMFKGCSGLTELDLSNFRTQPKSYFSGVFTGCTSLQKLDISGLDTKNVTDFQTWGNTFGQCTALTTVNWPGEGKWASNANIKTFDISDAPLDVDSIKGLVTALATKTSQCTLKLKSANWEAAKAADSTLETTLSAKNWVVTAV